MSESGGKWSSSARSLSAKRRSAKAEKGTMSSVCFAVVVLVCLGISNLAAPPGCGHGAGCRMRSLAELFDRVIQQSSRIHGVSSDLHSEFEQYSFPNRILKGKRRCHTSNILTPDDKGHAQKLGREQLIDVILKLLGAWGHPLSQLHWSIISDQDQDHEQDKDQDFSHYRTNKAVEISNMVRELSHGVAIMVEKMKLLGVLGNTVGQEPPESLAPSPDLSFYRRREVDSLDRHDLLYCLRRDSNKVKNYLRVLKCATFPGPDC